MGLHAVYPCAVGWARTWPPTCAWGGRDGHEHAKTACNHDGNRSTAMLSAFTKNHRQKPPEVKASTGFLLVVLRNSLTPASGRRRSRR